MKAAGELHGAEKATIMDLSKENSVLKRENERLKRR